MLLEGSDRPDASHRVGAGHHLRALVLHLEHQVVHRELLLLIALPVLSCLKQVHLKLLLVAQKLNVVLDVGLPLHHLWSHGLEVLAACSFRRKHVGRHVPSGPGVVLDVASVVTVRTGPMVEISVGLSMLTTFLAF